MALLKIMHLDTRRSNHTLLVPMNQCLLGLPRFFLLGGWEDINEKKRSKQKHMVDTYMSYMQTKIIMIIIIIIIIIIIVIIIIIIIENKIKNNKVNNTGNNNNNNNDHNNNNNNKNNSNNNKNNSNYSSNHNDNNKSKQTKQLIKQSFILPIYYQQVSSPSFRLLTKNILRQRCQ